MAQVCARCAVVFRGRTALDLRWCKVDRFYVCRRCWEWECHEGHGKGDLNVGRNIGTALMLILIVWVFAGTWPLAAIVDGLRVQSFATLGVTPISALPAMGTVKVRGVIADSDPVAWGGREVSTDNGWTWVWSAADSFGILDPTGGINTTTNRWWVVETASHPAPGAIHTAGTVYVPGDAVLVVGDMAGAGGSRHLEVLYISPDGFGQDPRLPLVLGTFGTLPFIAASGALFWQRNQRLARHGTAFEDRPLIDGAQDVAARDASLPWKENPGRMSVRGRLVGTTVAIGAAGIALIVLSTVAPFHTRGDIYFVGWLYGLILFVLVFLPLLGAFVGSIRPTAIAVTERKSGAKDDLRTLSAENFNALSLEWKLREGFSQSA